MAQILEGLAHLAVAEEDYPLGVKLFVASQARREALEMRRWAHQESEYQHNLSLTHEMLPAPLWQSAWQAGYKLPYQNALEFASTL